MFTTLCALTLTLAPQVQDDASLREAFAKLSRSGQTTVLKEIDKRLAKLEDPTLQRILAAAKKAKAGKKAAEQLPRDNRSPLTRAHKPGSEGHLEHERRFPEPIFMPELHKATIYDWYSGKVVATAKTLPNEQLFANLLRGFPPGADRLLAQTIASLDTDKAMRKLAKWFGYRYVRLDGDVYLGIDQYRAWYSGQAADLADNEAVRFAKEILADKSYRKPLSADIPRRTALYLKISEAARSYRQYRTLRETLAATVFVAVPTMDSRYTALLPRLHYLHNHCGEDLKELGKLIGNTDRDGLLQWIDQQVVALEGGVERVKAERSAPLMAMQELFRSTAIAVFQEG